jgi:hypothetical protein
MQAGMIQSAILARFVLVFVLPLSALVIVVALLWPRLLALWERYIAS